MTYLNKIEKKEELKYIECEYEEDNSSRIDLTVRAWYNESLLDYQILFHFDNETNSNLNIVEEWNKLKLEAIETAKDYNIECRIYE